MVTFLPYLSAVCWICFGTAEVFSRHDYNAFNLNKTFVVESAGARFGLECVARCALDEKCFGCEWAATTCRLAQRGLHPVLIETSTDSTVYLKTNYTEYLAVLHPVAFGGSGGTYYTDEKEYLQFGNLNAFRIYWDTNDIRVHVPTYGTHYGPVHGLEYSTTFEDFTLLPGELIQFLTLRAYASRVYALQFNTTTGRQSPMVGSNIGLIKTCDLSPRCLGFIAGRVMYALDRIYFYTIPC